MKKQRSVLRALVPLTLGGALILPGCAAEQPCSGPMAARDSTPRTIVVLGDNLAPLRSAFNDNSQHWRVVALVSPTCSECILGADAVQQEITARYPSAQVAAFVVWIPMLDTDDEQAARQSATIFPPQRAAQFYDGQQTLGTRYARETFFGFYKRARASLPDNHHLAAALDDRVEVKRPQWDLYMLYAPGVRWKESDKAPPMPTHWIRHLGRKTDRTTSTYWQDTPESGPREGDLFAAMRAMAEGAIGKPELLSIEVLGFEGCPNTPQTKANVENALKSIGLAATVVYVDQMTLSPNDRRRGWPAPTVLVDGRDLFGMAEPTTSAMRCRTYAGGAPSEREIIDALKSAAR